MADDDRGLVLVYTGNGKGKTTAALGLALRAVGHGSRVFIVQFMKGDPEYGELKAIRQYLSDPVEIAQCGLPTFVERGNPSPEDMRLARQGLDLAARVLREGRHRLVILDEANVAMNYGLLDPAEVLHLIGRRAPGTDVVLTGRWAPPVVIEAADLVTEMVEVKHPFQRGVMGRRGMEH